MLPGPTDVAKGRADGRRVVVGRPLDVRHPFLAQELPHRASGLDSQVLPFRVKPRLVKALHEQGPGSDAGKEHVLVERQGVRIVGVLVIGAAKPMAERDHLGGDRLAEIPLREGHSTSSGLDRDHHGEALIKSPGDEGGVSEAGLSRQDHPALVKSRILLYHVHGSQNPCPSHQRGGVVVL